MPMASGKAKDKCGACSNVVSEKDKAIQCEVYVSGGITLDAIMLQTIRIEYFRRIRACIGTANHAIKG